MQPPICALCNCDFLTEHMFASAGGLVRFIDFAPLAEGATGHPAGYLWFCADHVQEAQSLSHLSSSSALTALHARHENFPPYRGVRKVAVLYVLNAGPRPGEVSAVLEKLVTPRRRPQGHSLQKGTFTIKPSNPKECETLTQALAAVGAEVELRFVEPSA